MLTAPNWLFWACVIVHLAVSGLVFLLIKTDILKVSSQLFPMVLFVPFWGAVSLLFAEHQSRRGINGREGIDIHKFSLEEGDYHTLGLTQDNTLVSVVPVEEAILINDQKTRREFMMDVISQDSQSYISLLQKARFNDDIEVAHYASTAIMEIQRNYELKVLKYRELYDKEPENPEHLDSLIATLKSYIQSGLIEESVLLIQRRRYHEALMKRIAADNSDPQYYYDAIDNQIELGAMGEALSILRQTEIRWPLREDVWLLKLKLHYMNNDGDKLRQTIAQMKRSKLFLSAETKEMMQFWGRETAAKGE